MSFEQEKLAAFQRGFLDKIALKMLPPGSSLPQTASHQGGIQERRPASFRNKALAGIMGAASLFGLGSKAVPAVSTALKSVPAAIHEEMLQPRPKSWLLGEQHPDTTRELQRKSDVAMMKRNKPSNEIENFLDWQRRLNSAQRENYKRKFYARQDALDREVALPKSEDILAQEDTYNTGKGLLRHIIGATSGGHFTKAVDEGV